MSIKAFLRYGCFLTVVGMISASWAHHAAVGFDRTKRFIFTGTVEEFAWVNPHAYLYINVTKKDGSTELWGFETGGATRLNRAGWQKSDFPHGTKITVYASAARNGNRNALCAKVVFPDGRELAAVDTGLAGLTPPGAPGGAEPGAGRSAAADYIKYE